MTGSEEGEGGEYGGEEGLTSGQGKGVFAYAKPRQSMKHHPKGRTDIHALITHDTHTNSITLPLSLDTRGTERAQSAASCSDASLAKWGGLSSTPSRLPHPLMALPLQQRVSFGVGRDGGG